MVRTRLSTVILHRISCSKTRLPWLLLLTAALLMLYVANTALRDPGTHSCNFMGMSASMDTLRADNPNTERCRCLVYYLSASDVRSNTNSAVPVESLPKTDFYIGVLNAKSPRRGDTFAPQISATELAVMMRLLRAFLDLCKQYRIEAMLYGGTLLGSYRHHGIVPWDDTVELLLKESDMALLETALSKESTGMKLAKAGRWKVWNQTACITKPSRWCWPFLDISFYRVHDDVVYDTVATAGYSHSYPVDIVFPLHKRPFMGLWISAPRDTATFLETGKASLDDCIGSVYSQKLSIRLAPTGLQPVNCRTLTSTYPFVTRNLQPTNDMRSGNWVYETLEFNRMCFIYKVQVQEELHDPESQDCSLQQVE